MFNYSSESNYRFIEIFTIPAFNILNKKAKGYLNSFLLIAQLNQFYASKNEENKK
jgi:hypothetical protein